jgi:predicted RND superfamily exporter protein
VLTELAIMVLNGWEFGISESTGIVVVIGLSVDYVVHLSAAYMHSPFS